MFACRRRRRGCDARIWHGGLGVERSAADRRRSILLGDVSDVHLFDATATATVVGAAVLQVWKALAAVLHMSNIAFDAKDDAQGEVAAVQDAAVRLAEMPHENAIHQTLRAPSSQQINCENGAGSCACNS